MTSDNSTNKQMEDDELDPGKILILIIENWALFAISVLLCLVIGYAYIWYSHPVYEMAATVLVEDEGNDISQSILDEVGVLGKKRNIENEIAILNSRSLIEKAIGTLTLNISYTANLGLRKRDLYGNSPMKLDYVLSESASTSFLFLVQIKSNSEAQLSYELVDADGSWVRHEQTVVFGEPFSNPIGKFNLLKTEVFTSHVLDDVSGNLDYELLYQSNDQLTTNYLELLTVEEARQKASILRLTLRDKVQQRGVDVLDAILNVYILNNIEKKNQLASNSLKFIDLQLEVNTTDLSELEGEIKTYKMVHGVSDVSAEAHFFLEQVGTLDRTVSGIDVKLSIINYLENYVSSDQNLRNASPSSLGIEDPLLTKLIIKLSELTAERESMLRFTREENPLVNSIDTRISEAKEALINNIASIQSGLAASKTEIQNQLKEVEKKVKTLPKAEYELLALQRQYSIKESLYLLLLEKRSENSILLASTVSDNSVLDKARSSGFPVKPKKNTIYLLGLLVGLGIPSIYILLIIIFDNRIKDFDDLKQASKIPFLGIIPHHTEESYIVVNNNVNSAIAESFRSIRTNLSFLIRPEDLTPGVSPKIIQLTSAMGSEGKSFCSINLSASLALSNSKTVVVGLDLRKPKLAEYFNISNGIGASSVLAGINTLDEAIVSTSTENLDVLVGGPIPPNPSELLMSNALAVMLLNLTEKYDHVILDTPPIGLVTDSLIISERAATTIYVVRQNVTNASGLAYINDLYNSKKIRSVSLLFNDVKSSRFGYGYGYGYGYGNGYYSESTNLTRLDKVKQFFTRS